MPDPIPVSSLYRGERITSADLDATSTAWLAEGRPVGPQALGAFKVDVAAAVAAHGPSAKAIADEAGNPGYTRMMVRTAIVMAHAVPA